VLIALAVLLVVGLVMTLATAVSVGDGADLLSGRVLVVVAGTLVISTWFVWLARDLRRGSNRARIAAGATLLVAAFVLFIGCLALAASEHEGDGAGYMVMGAVFFACMCAPPGILLARGLANRTARRSS
jgi:hypothetical protein